MTQSFLASIAEQTPRSLSAEEVQAVAGGPTINNGNELVADAPRTLSPAEVVVVAGGPTIKNGNELVPDAPAR